MKSATRFQPMEKIFLVFLVISQVYYGYRYIMQYSSEGTSQTYSNTPFAYQAAKYVITAALFIASFAMLAARYRARVSISNSAYLFLIALAGFFTYSMVVDLTTIGNETTAFGNTAFLKGFFFFPLLALLPYHYRGRESLMAYFSIVVVYGLVYHVVYSLFQFFCYFAFGRVPALGYMGGLVRFGGGWDDPNGFGTYLTLPLLVLISGKFVKGLARYTGMFVLLVLMALTSSVTGVFGLLCAVVFYAALRRRFLIVFLVAAPVITALSVSSELQDLIAFVYESKSRSIEEHVSQLSLTDFIGTSGLSEWLVGQHIAGGAMNESFYLNLLQNYGLVGVLWAGALLFATMIVVVRKAEAAKRQGDLYGAEIFMILASFVVGFCASSVVTPAFYDFPINLYFWLSVFIIWLTPGDALKAWRRVERLNSIPGTLPAV
jgi:hypothetical protein